MTILEFLKTHDAETIAQKITSDFNSRISNGFALTDYPYFDGAYDCPEECEYLCQGYSYEDAWMNGGCVLDEDEKCPYHVDRDDSICRQIIEWLNSEIEARE